MRMRPSMAHGRVLLTGPPGDPLLKALEERIVQAGYWAQHPGLGLEAVYGSVAGALPIVAAVDLWPTLDEESTAYLQAIDAQMPLGSPLLVLCESMHVDSLGPFLKRHERLIGFSILNGLE